MFGAMHGTIMVFFGVVPLGFAAFGNYVTPLQIGAPDMAFPRLNMWSFWLFFIGGVIMVASFFLPTGAAQAGWTNYSPLAATVQMNSDSHFWTGQTQWLLAMVFNITASLLGAVNVHHHHHQSARQGHDLDAHAVLRLGDVGHRLPASAGLPAAGSGRPHAVERPGVRIQLLPAHRSFTKEAGLLNITGGGHPLLFQHLFWFLAHPEVYVLLLPAIAIVSEVIPCNTRKPLWGYKSMVYAVLALAFLSFIVWAHHMYLTGMGSVVATFFQITTVLISVPSVILLTCLMISLWGGSIRFPVPMLFATAFLPMFGIGGLTGLPLAFTFIDLYLHDTYYVIAHFHYVVAPGVIFGLFAGIYHWFPKDHRPDDEQHARPPAFLAFPDLHERPLRPDVHPRHGRIPPPLVRRRQGLRNDQPQIFLPQRNHLLGCMGSRHCPGSFHHQFLLQRLRREKSDLRQSMERHHPGVEHPHPSSPRQLPHRTGRLPRPLRIQRSRVPTKTSPPSGNPSAHGEKKPLPQPTLPAGLTIH